jgi:hypothetical protein
MGGDEGEGERIRTGNFFNELLRDNNGGASLFVLLDLPRPSSSAEPPHATELEYEGTSTFLCFKFA